MKFFLLFALAIPSFAFSQKKITTKTTKPYFSFDAEMMKYSSDGPRPAASISFGIQGKIISGGIGALITQLNGTGPAYIPIFAQLRAFQQKKKASPLVQVRIGYGTYSKKILQQTGAYQFTTTKMPFGGAYFQPGIGVRVPSKKMSVNIIASYVNSTFNVDEKYADSYSYGLDGFTISVGLQF